MNGQSEPPSGTPELRSNDQAQVAPLRAVLAFCVAAIAGFATLLAAHVAIFSIIFTVEGKDPKGLGYGLGPVFGLAVILGMAWLIKKVTRAVYRKIACRDGAKFKNSPPPDSPPLIPMDLVVKKDGGNVESKTFLGKGAIGIAVTAMLLIGLTDLPHGYYVLLRFVVCGAFAFWAWEAFEAKRKIQWKLCAGIAAIYQPFLPLDLGRDLWEVVNVATVGVIVAEWIPWRRFTRAGFRQGFGKPVRWAGRESVECFRKDPLTALTLAIIIVVAIWVGGIAIWLQTPEGKRRNAENNAKVEERKLALEGEKEFQREAKEVEKEHWRIEERNERDARFNASVVEHRAARAKLERDYRTGKSDPFVKLTKDLRPDPGSMTRDAFNAALDWEARLQGRDGWEQTPTAKEWGTSKVAARDVQTKDREQLRQHLSGLRWKNYGTSDQDFPYGKVELLFETELANFLSDSLSSVEVGDCLAEFKNNAPLYDLTEFKRNWLARARELGYTEP